MTVSLRWRLLLAGAGLLAIVGSTLWRERMIFVYRDALDECTSRVAADEENLRDLGKTSDLLSKHLLHAACDGFCSQLRLPPEAVFLTGSGQLECRCGHQP